MLTAVTGINWGDEGKGRVVDLLSEHARLCGSLSGRKQCRTYRSDR